MSFFNLKLQFELQTAEILTYECLMAPYSVRVTTVICSSRTRDPIPSFGHQMRRTDSFEKTLMLGKIEGRSRRG